MVTIDELAKLLPASTTLYGLHDSGNYVNISPRDPSQDSFMEQCEKAYELYDHPKVNDKCANEYVQDTWKCLCGQYMLPLVETPSQIIFYLYDSYQLSLNIGHNPSKWTNEDCQYAKTQFRPAMIQTFEILQNSTQHVVFAPTCYDHGILTSPTFQSINIDGLTAEEQLNLFINDNVRRNQKSSCEQVNCEGSCDSIDFGPNSFC